MVVPSGSALSAITPVSPRPPDDGPDRRAAVLRRIADEIARVGGAGVTRVAIDGVDGAGKTTFADELGAALEPSGRQVIGSRRIRRKAFDLEADAPIDAAEETAAADAILVLDGQRIYLARCRPQRRATRVIDKNDLTAPFTRRTPSPGRPSCAGSA